MPRAGAEGDSERQQLEKILASPGFSRNERLSRFLRFIVESHLAGRDGEVKESVIGVEVFGRSPDFNPKRDAVVRTEAARLRARLNEYYLNGGASDALIIEVPKGGYTAIVRDRPIEAFPVPEVRPTSRRFAVAVALGLLAIAAAAFALLQRGAAPIRIAVLPLESQGNDPDAEAFSDGLTSELIRDLSIVDGLTVRSQTSSFALKGRPRAIAAVARELQADYLVEGSVLRDGKQLRVTAQLIRAKDDVPIWSNRFDREWTDIMSIQDEISKGIVNALRLRLNGGRTRYESNPEAYQLYLRAQALRARYGISGYNDGVAPLEKATALDHSFAPAYAALATAYTLRSAQFRFDIGDELRKMRIAADQAIRLDPLLPEAQYAAAMAASREGQWEKAERGFRRAIELNRRDLRAHHYLAFWVLFPLGRLDEALRELRMAEELDPLDGHVQYESAFVSMSAGRFADAERHCARLQPEFLLKNECLAWARLRLGKVEESIRTVEQRSKPLSPGDPERAPLGCAYVRAGRLEEARRIAAESTFNAVNHAHILVCLGDLDGALQALDRATALGPFRVGRQLAAPEFAVLRRDPRLAAIRNKVGLPE